MFTVSSATMEVRESTMQVRESKRRMTLPETSRSMTCSITVQIDPW
jgi:hypothetical protein